MNSIIFIKNEFIMKRSTNKRRITLSESQLANAIEKTVKEYVGTGKFSQSKPEKTYTLSESQIVDIVEEAHRRKRVSDRAARPRRRR